MKRGMLLALGVVMAAISACSDRDPSTGVQERTALVRFVNATDAATLTAQVEGVDVATVQFGAASSCGNVEAGVTEIGFRQPGVSTVIASTVTNLARGGRYVVLATGASAGARVVVAETPAGAVASGSTAMRVVHAAGALASADVHLTSPTATLGAPTQGGVLANTTTPQFVVPAGPSRLRITAAGSSDVLLDQPIDLPSGQFRMLVITNTSSGGLQHFVVDRCG